MKTFILTKDKFPYNHTVDEKNKIVTIYWDNNGQIGRYGVPHNIEKFYPGYSYKFCNNEN